MSSPALVPRRPNPAGRQMMIRAARPTERLVLEELQRRSALEYADTRAALLDDPDLIELPVEHIAYTLVAESRARALGFAVILPRDDGDAELDSLFVEPGLWREGVGRGLVEAGVEAARARGAATLHVIASLHALDFYRACGFVDGELIVMQLSNGLEMHLPLAA